LRGGGDALVYKNGSVGVGSKLSGSANFDVSVLPGGVVGTVYIACNAITYLQNNTGKAINYVVAWEAKT
jgi:hypothetical protein